MDTYFSSLLHFCIFFHFLRSLHTKLVSDKHKSMYLSTPGKSEGFT